MDRNERALDLVAALLDIGIIRATFSVDGELTSFEALPDSVGVTAPAPPPSTPEPDQGPEPPDDMTAAANRLMGRRPLP